MTSHQKTLVSLSHISLADSTSVGNKAAILGELMQHGVNVPNGYCITTFPFKIMIDSLLSSLSFNSSQTKKLGYLSNLPERILQCTIPTDLLSEIEIALNTIEKIKNAPLLFCIRSSASVEDRFDHSFAGQFYTSIGVIGFDDVVHAIKQCWASLYNEYAISYSTGLDIKLLEEFEAFMGIIIQVLVPAEKSGVIFTCDPITGEHVLLIEATWGLGLPLVSGQITPDHIRVEPSGKVLDFKIGTKNRAVMVVNRILKEIIVEPTNRADSCLNGSEINLLLKEAKKIEAILGTCQDIEFAFFNNQLWILQSRPITKMKNLPI